VTERDERLEKLLAPIVAWARSRSDIVGLALVGSHARGAARLDSDIDLAVLACDPKKFRQDKSWLEEIAWSDNQVAGWRDADYGSVWSRHVAMKPSCEIEFTFCDSAWTATNPIEPGTLEVISGGCRILVDKAKLLQNLLSARPHV
jgi:hypothetical protein